MEPMAPIESSPPTGGKTPTELDALRTITMVVYGLQAASFLFGLTAIVGLMINYIKREDVRGTVYESHFDWQIRSFWWGLLWFCVGLALAIVVVGGLVLFVAYLWLIYRVVKGWLKLMDGKPVHPA